MTRPVLCKSYILEMVLLKTIGVLLEEAFDPLGCDRLGPLERQVEPARRKRY